VKHYGWAVLLAALIAVGLHDLTHTVLRPLPPRIVPQRETVTVVQFRTLTQHLTVVQPETTFLERVVTAPPETVRVLTHLTGIQEVRVGRRYGIDSTVAVGFAAMKRDTDTVVTIQPWLYQWYTPGPLRALSVSHADITATFDAPPKPPCRVGCALKKYLIGGGIGYAACRVR